MMRELIEQVIAGIAAGGIYASLALALVIIYRAMGLINFAQGEFAMFSAFVCWALLEGADVPFGLAIVISVIVAFGAAFAIERVIVRPFERGSPLVAQSIFRIIESINRDSVAAVELVEQNAVAALDISHRAYVLEAGRVAVSGSSAELEEHEGVRRSYLGY